MGTTTLTASIIIPAFNAEKYLGDCLNSITSVNCDDFEIIVIDDGSKDETGHIADEFARRYDFIRVIHQKNQGVSAARNAGIVTATGEYLIFVDSDDKVDGTRLRNILSVLQVNKGIDLFILPWFEGNEEAGYIQKTFSSVCNEIISLNDIVWEIVKQKMNEPWKRIIRREILSLNGVLFDTHMYMGEDVCFLVDAMRYVRKCMYIDEPYYYYRKNADSVCANVKVSYIDQSAKVFTTIHKYLCEIEADEKLLKKNKELLLRITSRNIQALKNSGISNDIIRRALYDSSVYDIIRSTNGLSLINHIRKWIIILGFYKCLAILLNYMD